MSYKGLKEKAEKEKAIEDLTPEYIAWEKTGQLILGKFISSSAVASGMGEGTYNQYLFETDEGLVKFSLGAATDKELDTLLVHGNVYEIKFLGKEKIAHGRSVNKFTLSLIARASELPADMADRIPF